MPPHARRRLRSPRWTVIKIDPVSGAQTVVSTGQLMLVPVGIARNAAGMLFVTDSPQSLGQPTVPSQVIQVDPAGASTTNQTLVTNSGLILARAGKAVATDETLLTANVKGNSIVRIDLTGSTPSTVSTAGDLTGAFGWAIFAAPPNFTEAVSRKVQGTAGTFNLPLTP